MADLPLRQKVAETRFFSVKNGNFATSLLFFREMSTASESFGYGGCNQQKADTPKK